MISLVVMETGQEEGRNNSLSLNVHVTEEYFFQSAEPSNWWQKYLELHLRKGRIEDMNMQETYGVVQ